MPRSSIDELHRAVKFGSVECVLALLSSGSVDIKEATSGGMTPIFLRRVFSHYMFRAHHRGHFQAPAAFARLVTTIGFSTTRVTRILLKRGASTSMVDGSGYTGLHMAAAGGYIDAIKLLAKAGAELKAAGSANGFTPLHLAVQNGVHVGAMRVLIEAGANPTAARILEGQRCTWRLNKDT